MSRIRSAVTLRRVLFAGCLLAVLVTSAMLVPSDAEAILGVCYYYSDATYTTVVGARGTGCCGEEINWGIITSYRQCQQIYCLDVQCPW